jgi:opacity protein-like surface antigen
MNTTQVISRRSYFKMETFPRTRLHLGVLTRPVLQAHAPSHPIDDGGLPFGSRCGVDNSIIANVDDGGLVGWTAGVGVEHMFAPHWTLGGEWRYVDLGTHTAQCVNGNNVFAGHAEFR